VLYGLDARYRFSGGYHIRVGGQREGRPKARQDGGPPLASGNYTAMSDTLITVTAPSSLAAPTDQRGVVQTELGPSNANLTIRISDPCGVGEAGPRGPLGEAGRELDGQREFVVHGS